MAQKMEMPQMSSFGTFKSKFVGSPEEFERQFRPRKIRLHFPLESMPLYSSFKVYVFQTVYEAAKSVLGSSLRTATVSVYQDYQEPTPPALLLQILADLDSEKFSQAMDAIVKEIALESMLWSDDEKTEYRETLLYELIPANL